MKIKFIVALMAVAALISGCSGGTNSTETSTPVETSATDNIIVESEAIAEELPSEEVEIFSDAEEVADPEPVAEKWTVSQENALGSAESYLAYSSFSREGLIKQLEFEGYSNEDSIWAVDMVNADWKEQAAKSAQSYLDYSSFSRSGLIDQLEFEGYTRAQAEYGVDQVGL